MKGGLKLLIRTVDHARQALVQMLVHVERGDLDQAAQCDLAILGFLKMADRDTIEIRALMQDLLAAYRNLKGKLSDQTLAAREEISQISTAKEGVSAYNRVRQY